jgi:hypothetical protein
MVGTHREVGTKYMRETSSALAPYDDRFAKRITFESKQLLSK